MRHTPWLPGAFLTALTLYCPGCGDDGQSSGFPSETTCGLSIRTRGDLSIDLDESSGPRCLAHFAGANGIDASFEFLDQDTNDVHLRSARIQVFTVIEGETGDFPAAIELVDSIGRQWPSDDCVATITEHELIGLSGGHSYRVGGRLRCEPVQRAGGFEEEADLSSLRFVVPVHWD